MITIAKKNFEIFQIVKSIIRTNPDINNRRRETRWNAIKLNTNWLEKKLELMREMKSSMNRMICHWFSSLFDEDSIKLLSHKILVERVVMKILIGQWKKKQNHQNSQLKNWYFQISIYTESSLFNLKT